MLTQVYSRTDAFFGNNHAFNETIFEETKAYWTGPILDPEMLADSKVARQINSKAYNPTYTFNAKTEQFSLGEVAAPIIAFGDIQTGTVNRSLVEYFFGELTYSDPTRWCLIPNVPTHSERATSYRLGLEETRKGHKFTGHLECDTNDKESQQSNHSVSAFSGGTSSRIPGQLARLI